MLALLEKSGVLVHLDPRKEGVTVPNWFKKQPELVLHVGLNMPVPIPDLEVDDDGVFCTLSFSRTPFYCRMPWHAIYALRSDEDNRAVVWPEDVPSESKILGGAQKPAKRPHLRAVGPDEKPRGLAEVHPIGGAAAAAAGAQADDAEEAGAEHGTCGECGVIWPEDQTSCVVCGASRAEAYKPGADPAAAAEPAAAQADDVGTETGGVGDAGDTDKSSDDDASSPPKAALASAPDDESGTKSRGNVASLKERRDSQAPPPAVDDGPRADGNAATDGSQPPPPPDDDGGKKGKRKLPPYLRIVK